MNKIAQEYARGYKLIMNKQKEVEKAIYSMGEYRFRLELCNNGKT